MLPAGSVLDPEYKKHDALANMEVQQGFVRMAQKLLPDVDLTTLTVELMRFRWTLLYIVLCQELSCALLGVSHMHLPGCRNQKGVFSQAGSAASTMASWEYWNMWGSETPALRKLAMRVLSKVPCL